MQEVFDVQDNDVAFFKLSQDVADALAVVVQFQGLDVGDVLVLDYLAVPYAQIVQVVFDVYLVLASSRIVTTAPPLLLKTF
ncbi:MAG: hypothetical protein V1875_04385 [Candidatus Altiarchaeota archaeon]